MPILYISSSPELPQGARPACQSLGAFAEEVGTCGDCAGSELETVLERTAEALVDAVGANRVYFLLIVAELDGRIPDPLRPLIGKGKRIGSPPR